jgi:hypothetical protein
MLNRLFYTFVLVVSFSVLGKSTSQLGLAVDNFTLTDINGVTYDLDEMMREGTHVILNFGTTWAPSSWNYEKTQTLSNINKLYDLDGGNKVVTLFLETDINTNVSCINGTQNCNFSSMGDWSKLVDYPIINLTQEEINMLKNYEITEFPTVYGIKPDRSISSLGQADMNRVLHWINGTSFASDIKIIDYLTEKTQGDLLQPIQFGKVQSKLISNNSYSIINVSEEASELSSFKYTHKFVEQNLDEKAFNIFEVLELLEIDMSAEDAYTNVEYKEKRVH